MGRPGCNFRADERMIGLAVLSHPTPAEGCSWLTALLSLSKKSFDG